MALIKVKLGGKASSGPEVIILEFILKLQIKCNDWLLADMCPQAANHCALYMSASSQSLGFIWSLRLYSSFINLGPGIYLSEVIMSQLSTHFGHVVDHCSSH